MKTAHDFLVVYDNNCHLCRTLAALAVRLRIAPATSVAGYGNLSDTLRQQIDAERFRYEEAVLTPNGILYGLAGILAVVAVHIPAVAAIQPDTRSFRVLNWLYNTISWNRYLFMGRKGNQKAPWEPKENPALRWRFIAICWTIAIAISALLGFALALQLGTQILATTLGVLAIVGTGWAVQILWSRLALNLADWLEYLGNLGVIMVVGVLVLLPSITLALVIPPVVWLPFMFTNVLVSSGVMLRMHMTRVRGMKLRPWWNVAWFAALQSTAVFWIYTLLNQPSWIF